jgi:hypothetical protein
MEEQVKSHYTPLKVGYLVMVRDRQRCFVIMDEFHGCIDQNSRLNPRLSGAFPTLFYRNLRSHSMSMMCAKYLVAEQSQRSNPPADPPLTHIVPANNLRLWTRSAGPLLMDNASPGTFFPRMTFSRRKTYAASRCRKEACPSQSQKLCSRGKDVCLFAYRRFRMLLAFVAVLFIAY